MNSWNLSIGVKKIYYAGSRSRKSNAANITMQDGNVPVKLKEIAVYRDK